MTLTLVVDSLVVFGLGLVGGGGVFAALVHWARPPTVPGGREDETP
jgi:hypothetical protein